MLFRSDKTKDRWVFNKGIDVVDAVVNNLSANKWVKTDANKKLITDDLSWDDLGPAPCNVNISLKHDCAGPEINIPSPSSNNPLTIGDPSSSTSPQISVPSASSNSPLKIGNPQSPAITVPSNSNQLAVGFAWTPVGTAGAADYFEITNVQIELGTAATPFTRVGGNPAGEYALCQRYYQVIGDNIYELINGGYMQSGNSAYASWTLPVEMRTTPTGTKVGGWAVMNVNQPTLQASWPGGFAMQAVCNTTGHYYFHSNTTYYITMSEEI